MNCIVIEDNIVQEQLIVSHINETRTLNLLGSYPNCESAIIKMNTSKVDILFLDIEVPGMNGLEFLEKYNLQKDTHVIITTAKSKYAIKAFDNGVTDYLLKPISYNRFTKAIKKVIGKSIIESIKKDFMFIKSKGSFIKLLFQDIVWIRSSCEYVIIYTINKKYMIYSSMNKIMEKLPSSFIRIHRSNIVSIDKIDRIDGDSLELDGQMVKISKTYKNDLMSKLGIAN
ncbi:MAG: hypothetical protein COB15_10440 [Flavobacteriales bacterium]|nr:MAG: hypothetical protein COB15_10440 [Flavobacteriales bacterium]